jgi:hypothetical protein
MMSTTMLTAQRATGCDNGKGDSAPGNDNDDDDDVATGCNNQDDVE